MKVLFYSPVRLHAGGGCERWHCDVTNSLKKQFGYDVEIVTANLGNINWPETYLQNQLGGIQYTMLKFFNLNGILIPSPRNIWDLYNKFKKSDYIHFIHGFAGQDILVLLVNLFARKKILVGHHAPIFHGNKFHNIQMKYIARPLLNFFTGHMTLNAKDKEFLENKWLVKNVQFIPSGIRVERFLKLGRNIHQNLNFITVGIYRSQKGIDLSLSAISKFNDRYPGNKAIFRFVGGGELKPLIEKYKKSHKNVIDLGYLKYEDIPKAYAQSDLYLLSSREEPFGLVLIEAWSSGIPVISTKTEGPLDMVKPNINGWFIKNISPDSIYDSISSLYHKWLKKPDMFLQMADECRQTGKKYSIDRTAKSMNKYFFQQI